MHHCFVEKENILEDKIILRGLEVKHIKDVLRMKKGEKILISDNEAYDYICQIEEISKEEIVCDILDKNLSNSELDAEIVLFQALPKLDKMDLIIQKAVELGVSKIVPLLSSRCIVKLDEKKEKQKILRWQQIAKSAAEQAKRNKIPLVLEPLKYKEAISYASSYENTLLAYENERGILYTKELISKIKKGQKVAVFIGPEGGFCDEEIDFARSKNINIISLGNRILRTESAGFCILSLIMFHLEV